MKKIFFLFFISNFSLKRCDYLNYSGDIMLGGLFPIHKRGEGGAACGSIQDEDGIQPLEALLFTLDEINMNKSLLPGIKLGVIVKDTCDNPLHAGEQAVDLFQGFMYRKVKNMHKEIVCTNDTVKNIVGIIGAQTSEVTLEVARLGRLFRVPQVSYLSTAVVLSNKKKFPYFFRTVPSDTFQAKAMIEVIKEFGWNYVSVVHTETDYGTTGYEALVKHAAKENNLCLADPLVIHDNNYEEVITKLQANTMTKVVVVFADRKPAGELLEAAKRKNALRFIWVGSDAWASRESVVYGREEVVHGAIALQPLRRQLPGFNKYFNQLSKGDMNPRNPWYQEYYKTYCNCSHTEDDDDLNISICPFHNKRPRNIHQVQQPYIHFVRDAVYVFAHALHNLWSDTCNQVPGVCAGFQEKAFHQLKDYMQNVNFFDVDMFPFKFEDNTQDGPTRYSIISYLEKDGIFDWKEVGTYQNGKIRIMDSSFNATIRSESSEKHYVRCKQDVCNANAIKIPDGVNDGCCWHCEECHDFEYRKSEFECKRCIEGMMRNELKPDDCILSPEIYLDYTNPWALGALLFAGIGLIMTAITMGIFKQQLGVLLFYCFRGAVEVLGHTYCEGLQQGAQLCPHLRYLLIILHHRYHCC